MHVLYELRERHLKADNIPKTARGTRNISHSFIQPFTEQYSALRESYCSAVQVTELRLLFIFYFRQTEALQVTQHGRQTVVYA